jgi:hypothetical protein
MGPGIVAHTCNPSFLTGEDRRIGFKGRKPKQKVSKTYLKEQARHGSMNL